MIDENNLSHDEKEFLDAYIKFNEACENTSLCRNWNDQVSCNSCDLQSTCEKNDRCNNTRDRQKELAKNITSKQWLKCVELAKNI